MPLRRDNSGCSFASAGDVAHYYAGHLGSVVTVSSVFRRGGPKSLLSVHPVTWRPHYRTGHRQIELRLRVDPDDARTRNARGEPRGVKRGAHALVLMAWEGPASEGWIDGCHLNGNPTDNRLANLVWGDRRMNAAQREAHRKERERQIGLWADSDAYWSGAYRPDEDLAF